MFEILVFPPLLVPSSARSQAVADGGWLRREGGRGLNQPAEGVGVALASSVT